MDPLSSDIRSADLAEYLRRLRRWSWLVQLVLPADAGTSANLANGRADGAVNSDAEAQVIGSAVVSEQVRGSERSEVPA